ncbi:MAG TPA: hypothetical protein VGM16_01850 [Gammaproteobacteria bacterium]|jgi:hypothetical protein
MTFRALPILFALLSPSLAQAACADLQYRQFDFLLGDWNVATADGKLVGHDRVEKAYGGCVVQEHWTSVDGGTGGSVSIYDASRKLWHQTWVDSTGTLVVLEGGPKGGAMLMTGEMTDGGKRVQDRMSWTPQGGKIRQLWETSSDGGKTWQIIFDVYYSKG